MERFKRPNPGEPYPSEYDISSDEIADLIQRNPRTVSVRDYSLAAAGTDLIREAGFGFVIYGYSTVDKSKYSEAFMLIAPDRDDCVTDTSRAFPAKTGRGFHGPFSKLAVKWPADPNAATNSVKLIIFKSPTYPWIGGLEAQ